jgi:hypothetical protein
MFIRENPKVVSLCDLRPGSNFSFTNRDTIYLVLAKSPEFKDDCCIHVCSLSTGTVSSYANDTKVYARNFEAIEQ